MRPLTWSLVALLTAAPAAAQYKDNSDDDRNRRLERELILPPVVVTPTGAATVKLESPRSVDVITAEDLHEKQAATLPEALEGITGVHVQSTNRGAGAPYIRGLVGPQNLILIDGVRFNTSTFRTGPNQYLSLIDPFAIKTIEIVRGPSSVLYGNGAMGGVMHMLLADPSVLRTQAVILETRTIVQLNSADFSAPIGVEAKLAYGDWAFLAGGSYASRQPLRVGGGAEWPLSAYDNANWRLKAIWSPNPDWQIRASYMGALIENAGRTDQLGKGEVRQYDNLDHLAYLRASWLGSGAVRNVTATVSYHHLLEHVERFNCQTDETTGIVVSRAGCAGLNDLVIQKKRQNEDVVDTVGAEVAIHMALLGSRLRLTGGVDIYNDFVGSSRSDASAPLFNFSPKPRGNFGDGSTYLSLGVHTHLDALVLEAGGAQFHATAGGRFSHFAAFAPNVEGLGDVRYDFSGVVGSVGTRFVVPDRFTLYWNWVQGFRAPNLQEATVLGDTGSKFEVPNPELGPERSDTLEVGTRLSWGPVSAEAAYFASFLKDAVDERAATHNGASSVDGKPVVHRVNTAKAFVQGVEFGGAVNVWRMTIRTNVSWTIGDFTDGAGVSTPMRRIPPVQGTAAVRYTHKDDLFWVEAGTRWAGPQSRLHPSDRSDHRICETSRHSGVLQDDCEGSPGYGLLDLRAGFMLFEVHRFDLGVSNVTDANYRVHGSGYDGPGVEGRIRWTSNW